jgi:hypothetical protein
MKSVTLWTDIALTGPKGVEWLDGWVKLRIINVKGDGGEQKDYRFNGFLYDVICGQVV